MKILIIEDSDKILRSLGEGLRRTGFIVDLAADGQTGLAYARARAHDVIVLDIMLPKLDGLSVLKILRAEGIKTHVLILSARDQIEDRIRGLNLGADDYLVKPFAFDELCARIRALGRRDSSNITPDITLGDIVIKRTKKMVTIRGNEVPLSPSEYTLLEHLACHRGNVLSKDQLENMIHNFDSSASSNVVEVHLSSLRRKLKSSGASDPVKNRRGFGYIIE